MEVEPVYTTEKRLYLNADRTVVVEEGDPEARSLLIGAGGSIPDEDAARYGLTGKKAGAAAATGPVRSTHPDAVYPEDKAKASPAEQAPAEPEEAADAESKAMPEPPENKALTMKRAKAKDED